MRERTMEPVAGPGSLARRAFTGAGWLCLAWMIAFGSAGVRLDPQPQGVTSARPHAEASGTQALPAVPRTR
jgi:hypothetical protein